MTSNSSKIITNDQTGRNSLSEESERKGRTNNTKKILTHIREEDNTGGKTVVEEIYPVRKNDPQ